MGPRGKGKEVEEGEGKEKESLIQTFLLMSCPLDRILALSPT